MSENASENNRVAGTDQNGSGLPTWARTAVAFLGAIGALGALLTGFYQIQKEEHESQLTRQTETKNADKEIAQMRFSLKNEEVKQAKADLDRDRQQAATAADNRRAAELQLELKRADLKEAERQATMARQRDDDNRVRSLSVY